MSAVYTNTTYLLYLQKYIVVSIIGINTGSVLQHQTAKKYKSL